MSFIDAIGHDHSKGTVEYSVYFEPETFHEYMDNELEVYVEISYHDFDGRDATFSCDDIVFNRAESDGQTIELTDNIKEATKHKLKTLNDEVLEAIGNEVDSNFITYEKWCIGYGDYLREYRKDEG